MSNKKLGEFASDICGNCGKKRSEHKYSYGSNVGTLTGCTGYRWEGPEVDVFKDNDVPPYFRESKE